MDGTPQTVSSAIEYPFSDGKPLAENTQQLRWIMMLTANLAGQFRDRADVFVSGDQLWYPVEGRPDICFAPDVYVIFGRPKGDRLSYQQWLEDDVPMTVVFEILSPKNSKPEMIAKYHFYEEYGVEEYYVYDPDDNYLEVYLRQGSVFRRVWDVQSFVSPRLGIRFVKTSPEMTVYGPDGRPFLPADELVVLAKSAEQDRRRAEEAEQRAAEAKQRLARVLELSRRVRRGEVTAEELRELERLEGM